MLLRRAKNDLDNSVAEGLIILAGHEIVSCRAGVTKVCSVRVQNLRERLSL